MKWEIKNPSQKLVDIIKSLRYLQKQWIMICFVFKGKGICGLACPLLPPLEVDCPVCDLCRSSTLRAEWQAALRCMVHSRGAELVNSVCLYLQNGLLEAWTVEFMKEKKWLPWKSVLNLLRLSSKQWVLPLIQIKNLIHTVYGEIKSKSQIRKTSGISKWPWASLSFLYTMCACVSKPLRTVWRGPERCHNSGQRGGGSLRGWKLYVQTFPHGRKQEWCPMALLLHFNSTSPFLGKKRDWKIKPMHSGTYKFKKSSLESKTAGWEWSK